MNNVHVLDTKHNAEFQSQGGYLRIDNAMFDQLVSLPVRSLVQMRICLYIIRSSIGWRRSGAPVKIAAIAEAVGVSGATAKNAVSKLLRRNILYRFKENEQVMIGFNQDQTQWLDEPKISKKVTPELPKSNSGVTKSDPERSLRSYQKGNSEVTFSETTPYKRLHNNIHNNTPPCTPPFPQASPPVTSADPPQRRNPSKTALPDPFPLDDRMIGYAAKLGVTDLFVVEDWHEQFCLRCRAKGYVYADWFAAWQTWLRSDVKKQQQEKQHVGYKSVAQRTAEGTAWLHREFERELERELAEQKMDRGAVQPDRGEIPWALGFVDG